MYNKNNNGLNMVCTSPLPLILGGGLTFFFNYEYPGAEGFSDFWGANI